MSRLDRHVALVQNKLAMQRFVDALGVLLPVGAVVVIATYFIENQTTLTFQQKLWWFGAAGASLAMALAYSLWRRPKAHDAAVAIDERLGLKEKFSTALALRGVNDPFAMAAVRDAEHTADNVSLNRRFPMAVPQVAHWGVWLLMVVMAFAAWWLPADMFKRQAKAKEQTRIQQQQVAVRKSLDEDIAKVATIAKAFPNAEGLAEVRKELEKLRMAEANDPAQSRRTAAELLSGLEKSIKSEIAKTGKEAERANNDKILKGLEPAAGDKGPVAEAHRSLAKGDLDKAMKDLGEAVKNFDKMDEQQKKEAAKQMQAIAQQLAKQANPAQQQQQMQQQLQNAGMSQQQAAAMAQQIQQAAGGNQQAQQQLQQQMQQAMQQMNGGAGPTAQQQAAMQQMVGAMQAQAQGQMNAQQMAQAAQQMAQAMQQAAQQPGGQQPGGQQQGAGANQQQMQQAAQALQDQLAEMDAVAKDAQQQAAAQQAAQQAAADAAGQCDNPGAGQGQGAGQNPAGQPGGGKGPDGQWAKGDPNQGGQQGQGFGGPGQAVGGSPGKENAPFGTKQEVGNVQTDDKGKFIAAHYVKAGVLKGESLAELQQVTASAERTETDDVDAERITGEAKKAVKGYFGQLSGQEPQK